MNTKDEMWLSKSWWTVIAIALMSVTLIGCSTSGDDDSKLEAFITAVSPIMERHANNTDQTNESNVAMSRAYATGDRSTIVTALRVYRDDIDKSILELRTNTTLWRRLSPPSDMDQFHRLVLEGFLKETEGLQGLSNSYSSTLAGGP